MSQSSARAREVPLAEKGDTGRGTRAPQTIFVGLNSSRVLTVQVTLETTQGRLVLRRTAAAHVSVRVDLQVLEASQPADVSIILL